MNTVLFVGVAILMLIDIWVFIWDIRLWRENKWARHKIHKLITGDNIEMSLETLSLYYHTTPERIDQLLTMEKEYIDDGK